jgi:NAD(P)-dependent dehydrogenase (short-subunit alcohol dehydrogenase family)
MEKARAALADLPQVMVASVTLHNWGSVDAFAERLLERHDSIDLLIHSAGVMAPPLERCPEVKTAI